ncbi:MAG: sodium:calcium antiporter [Alphaproteobacteria bacterium]|nr:sodium:calcium antiporter [Alphaproteobacteria bacterium]MBL6939978.1 sodium:calcium antiporter [Alphaproteobacteria bacterium]MBL7098166.1 sodium:calcium antiporter [Alphaproteobacteria bacterium]
MITAFALLLGAAVTIYFSCEFFVNGVEWVGRKLGVSQTATGTILAAFGTALPESVVTLVATAFGNSTASKEIGIGAALGGPLALSTVAYGVVGIAMLVTARATGQHNNPVVQVDGQRLSRDQAWFLGIFVFKVALGLIAFAIKPWLGLMFLGAYAIYTWSELNESGEAEEGDSEPLIFRPRDSDPSLWWALLQTGIATVVIFAASRLFVMQLETVGPFLGLAPQVTALLLSPIATELPETMNAVIWVRQKKERLALANISGAMMIQATVPTAFGLFFTPWLFDRGLTIAGGVTMLAVILLWLMFRKGQVRALRLANVAWLYGVFAVLFVLFVR